MKKLLNVLVLSLVVLCSSCEKKEKYPPIGDCSKPPKLSSTELNFEKKGGTKEITVSEVFRFNMSTYNGKSFGSNSDDDLKIIEDEKGITFEHSDFTIKKSGMKIIVTMTENKSEKPRNLHVGIASGNCFTGFTVKQE